MKIWLNGKLVDRSEAKLSVYDHGTLYGDGVFEGIRVYNGRIFRSESHLDRLYESAREIRLAIPYTKQELHEAMVETVAANGGRYAYIRLVVTRGEGNLGLNPFQCPQPNVFVMNDDIQLYPREMYESGISVIIAKTIRTSPRMVSPKVKSLNYLNNILARIEAVDAGVSEAIMLNEHGNVSEATGDNIFIVKNGQVVTSPVASGILVGITRGLVMELARAAGLTVVEKDFGPGELYTADECFLTGSAAEVIPVTKIDDKTIGSGMVGEVTRRLVTDFRALIAREVSE